MVRYHRGQTPSHSTKSCRPPRGQWPCRITRLMIWNGAGRTPVQQCYKCHALTPGVKIRKPPGGGCKGWPLGEGTVGTVDPRGTCLP